MNKSFSIQINLIFYLILQDYHIFVQFTDSVYKHSTLFPSVGSELIGVALWLLRLTSDVRQSPLYRCWDWWWSRDSSSFSVESVLVREVPDGYWSAVRSGVLVRSFGNLSFRLRISRVLQVSFLLSGNAVPSCVTGSVKENCVKVLVWSVYSKLFYFIFANKSQ